MVTLLFTTSWPVVSVIVAGYVRLKSIVSPSFASMSACRSEPAPLSLLFITVMVTAEAWRQNEAATRRAMSLRERFIGVCGKLNFLRLAVVFMIETAQRT